MDKLRKTFANIKKRAVPLLLAIILIVSIGHAINTGLSDMRLVCEDNWIFEYNKSGDIEVQVIAERGLNVRRSPKIPEVRDSNVIKIYKMWDAFSFDPADLVAGEEYIWAPHKLERNNLVGYSALCREDRTAIYVSQYAYDYHYPSPAVHLPTPSPTPAPTQAPIDNDCYLTGWELIGHKCTTTDVDGNGIIEQGDIDAMFECGWYVHNYRVNMAPMLEDCKWFPSYIETPTPTPTPGQIGFSENRRAKIKTKYIYPPCIEVYIEPMRYYSSDQYGKADPSNCVISD